MKQKTRLDILLVERGLFSGRDRAKAAVMAREVMVDGQYVDKAGALVDPDAVIELKGNKLPFVSRGGLKLAKAIEVFAVPFDGKTVLDIGSSTGGFVDCALQNGAAKVYAVDVGYGQLAWELRRDSRVIVWEKTNARYLTTDQVPEAVDILTCDASFISLAKVLHKAAGFLKEGAYALLLVKPQFEAGRDKVGKKGVVRDAQTHVEVLEAVIPALAELGLITQKLDFSPITGPEGNIEYLLLAQKNASAMPLDPASTVAAAFAAQQK